MDNTANYQNNTQNFKFCRKCGRKLLADAEFCDSCGTRQISTETADIAETVSEPDVQYSNAQPVTPPPVYNGNNTTAGNAGVQYPQKKKQGAADNRNMRRGTSCYRFYNSHSVGCFVIGRERFTELRRSIGTGYIVQ